MSVVTNIILTSIPEENEAMDMINNWFNENNYASLVQVNQYGTRSKAMEANIFIGAYNYFNLKEFFITIKKAKWTAPETVKLFVKEEDDNCFSDRRIAI